MKSKISLAVATILAAALLAGCTGGKEGTTETSNGSGEKKHIIFSQANSQDPWRQVFDKDTKSAAEKYSSQITLQIIDAADKADVQNNHIETAIVRKPAVLLASPTNEGVKSSLDKAFDAGIPVILLDRRVPGDKYTAYVGGDNKEIGREAAKYMAKILNDKGTILMVKGIDGNSAAQDRKDGFVEALKSHPGIKIIEGEDCKFQREAARNYMDTILRAGKIKFDAIYAHNDEMAIGAFLAMKAAKAPKVPIVGIDACQKEVIDMIVAGDLEATFTYPQPGPKGIELAMDIINGKALEKKDYLLPTALVNKDNAEQYLKDNPNLAK